MTRTGASRKTFNNTKANLRARLIRYNADPKLLQRLQM
jgi:hypothetical protein